jgi:hypothetical protein
MPRLPQIPPEIHKAILPDEDLSILDILKFPLPAVARSITGPYQVQNFLSHLIPTVTTINEIQVIPTPPLTVLDELVRSPDLSVSQSVLCSHMRGLGSTERLPIWILSYWIQVSQLRPLKKKWLDADESLQKQEYSKQHTDDTKVMIKQVYNALACISWASNIQGFSASITTDHLATYLTKGWFSDEHENQMLYLLRQEVRRERGDDGIDICDTFFIKKLVDLHQDAGGPERYATAPAYAWLRAKGQELATGVLEMLATIANIGDNHWIALVIDFKNSRILYGDSMGGTRDEGIKNALTWWIGHHTGRDFAESYIPITRQRDGYSCGILSWLALAVFLLPESYSLPEAGVVADERLQMFLRVSDRHNAKVRNNYVS